jgi:hypothetical protein
MTKCKVCGHDDFTHHQGIGKCEAVLIKKESEFYKVTFAPGVDAWTQDIEYGEYCPCKVMITRLPKHYDRDVVSPHGNLDDFLGTEKPK